MSEHQWLGDVPAFVLGALDPDERAAFEAHLEECARCRAAVRENHRVTQTLADHVPAASPPPGLKAKVMAAAFEEGEGPSHDEVPRIAGAPTAPDAPAHRSPRWAPWLAAAAAAVFAVWAGLAYRQSAERADVLDGELTNARATIDSLRLEGARRDSMLLALAGGGIEMATLTATGNEPRVRLFRNRNTEQLLVIAFDLPQAPAGRTYQLWGLAPDADPVSLGTFDTGADGYALALQPLDQGTRYAQSAVTQEPAGGSPQPTTTPFLVGPWSPATE